MAIASGYLVVAGAVPSAHGEEWMLKGREGGCVTLEEPTARLPLLTDIETPDQLVARLRGRGEVVRRQDLAQGDVTIVQVDGPGLGLIFAPSSMWR